VKDVQNVYIAVCERLWGKCNCDYKRNNDSATNKNASRRSSLQCCCVATIANLETLARGPDAKLRGMAAVQVRRFTEGARLVVHHILCCGRELGKPLDHLVYRLDEVL
jgi:hypothetical protein